MSAIAAGFKNVVLMSDHGGGGQEALKRVAADMDAIWKQRASALFMCPTCTLRKKSRCAPI